MMIGEISDIDDACNLAISGPYSEPVICESSVHVAPSYQYCQEPLLPVHVLRVTMIPDEEEGGIKNSL